MKQSNFLNELYDNFLTIFFLAAFLVFGAASVWAQESVPVGSSELVGARLPANASRITDSTIPSEVSDALDKIVASGGTGLQKGATEVLAWTKGYKKLNAPNLIKQLTANLQTAGWTYEVGGENDGVTVFAVMTDAPKKRAVVGFYTFSDDAFVWAWTEMLAANSGVKTVAAKTNSRENYDSNSRVDNSSAKIIDVGKNDGYVNLMGSEMPEIPSFPVIKAKSGFVRGYAKDWTGKPLAGANIGVRASYFAGQYSGAQGKTDAKGYYEFAVPKGSAHFYNAGYALEWGDGIAAVGLHPADGNLDSFVTMDGAVENFVLLPYGITDRAKVQDNPQLPANYYGGSIWLYYGAYEASDNRPYEGYIPENSIIEITLRSDNGQTFVIRKTAGFQSYFRINNIPLARYEISAKVGGKSLNLEFGKRFVTPFGMSPEKTNGAASVLFMPLTAKADMVAPQTGGWDAVSINLKAR